MRMRTVLAIAGIALGIAIAPSGAGAAGVAAAAAPAQAPLVALDGGGATSPVKALIAVAINPLGLLTKYSIDYGTTTSYGSSTTIASILGAAGAATYDVSLRGLAASTVYHYRVVATNPLGTADSPDATFATWPVQVRFLGHGIVSKNNQLTLPGDGRPRGWVMVIHGGGWQSVGREAVASEDNTVSFVNGLGWAADNVDYRKGEHSLPDVLAAYDALRRKVGATTPICLIGHSAGGNLALLAAEYRKSVACVVSEAGPTDLVDFPDGHAFVPHAPKTATYSPAWAYEQFMVTSFGARRSVLREWSPVEDAGAIRAAVLLGASSHDELVPQAQMAELRTAMARQDAPGSIKTALLAGASTAAGRVPNFTHASITPHALARWQSAERHLLARFAA